MTPAEHAAEILGALRSDAKQVAERADDASRALQHGDPAEAFEILKQAQGYLFPLQGRMADACRLVRRELEVSRG